MTGFSWPSGVMTALVTPLRDDHVDTDAFARLIEFQIDNGAAGLVVTGGTGEYNFLTFDERLQLYRDAVTFAAGRVPVIAAPGCLATRDTIALSHAAEEAGVDAFLMTSAFGEPINWAERVNFFEQVAGALSLPIMVYNTGPAGIMNFEQIRELGDIDGITAVKDSSGNAAVMGDVLAWRPEDFGVYVGMDSFLFESLVQGANGPVFGAANFLPAELSRLVLLIQADDGLAEARALWSKLRPIMRFMEQVTNYVALCKVGCGLRGIDVGGVRLPNLMPDKAEVDTLAALLDALDT